MVLHRLSVVLVLSGCASAQESAPATEPANALEVRARLDDLVGLLRLPEPWADPAASDGFADRLLASFVNRKGWRFVSGTSTPDGDRAVSVHAHVALDRNLHTPFQARFFQAETLDRKQWLDPFLTLVPADACACAALRLSPGDGLKEMRRALEPALRDEIDDKTRSLGYAAGMPELIEKLEPALQPRIGLVFRRNIQDKEIPVVDPTPVPQIALVLWARAGEEKPLRELIEALQRNREALGLTPWKLSMSGNRQADSAYEFWNPLIPGTGEFAMMVFDGFFIVSNSGPLIRDMFNARIGRSPSLTASPTFKLFDDQGEIPSRGNGFVYLQARPLQALLEDWQAVYARRQAGEAPDPEWLRANRPRFETEVFERKYQARFGSTQALDAESKARFRNDVDAYANEQWSERGRAAASEPARATLRKWLAFAKSFSGACLTANLDPQSVRLAGKVLVDRR